MQYVTMPDRFTLLTLSLSLIFHNGCSSSSFTVSTPLNHTLNEDGSVSVTCVHDEHSDWEWDAKLKMNNKEIVCEVFNKSNVTDAACDWEREANKFKFTLKRLEARHKDQLFSCEISKVTVPIKTIEGKKTKLFQGCSIPFPPPGRTCSCPTATSGPRNCSPTEVTSPGNTHTFLIGGMIVVVVLLSLYSAILTGVYIRLRVIKVESTFDIPTYVPMQRKVRQHDADNTEYVDMREVQKQEGHIRDINYNC